MSSELERILREGRQPLGEPEAATTQRARAAALRAASRHRLFPPRRSSFTLAFALVAAVAVGIGLGAWVTPSGTAAQEPTGVGFLPADGWFVVQNATKATVERPAHAIASNVPLGAGDGGSIVPYATLSRLPRDGIVLVANFVVGGSATSVFGDDEPHTHLLPLQVADATPGTGPGGQIRPERPLGQYQLRARIDDYLVDLQLYFGTPSPSPALLAAAQSQLDQLIVAPDTASTPVAPAPPLTPAADVTLRLQRVPDVAGLSRLRFSGQIATAAEGEYVVVMQQRCGYSYSTAVAGAQSQAGGFWEATPESYASVATSATFRARWRDALSEPVTILQPIYVDHRRLRRGLFAVYVSGSNEDLARRAVILQRFRGGKWSGIQRGRLTRVSTSNLFQVRFTVKARGWKLRARVPKATAGKCLAPGFSEAWTT